MASKFQVQVLTRAVGVREGQFVSYRYKDLIVWQKARLLATIVYRATEGLPSTEVYGLRSQMRRAAVSIASNIAEGQGRLSKGEFRQFLGQSRGSLLELETQAAIAMDLGYFSPEQCSSLEEQFLEISRMLNGLIDSLGVRAASQSSTPTETRTRNPKPRT